MFELHNNGKVKSLEVPDYLHIAFKAIPLVLHLTGLFFLVKLRRYYRSNSNASNSKRSHLLHLINLSISEILFVTLGLVSLILIACGENSYAQYVLVIQYTTCCLQYFLAMIYMTVDRFLEIRLNIVYPVVWKYRYTKGVIFVTWVACGVFSVVILLSELPSRKRMEWIIFVYFYPIFESVFLALSVSIYGYIFVKLKQNSCHVYKKHSGLMKRRKKKHFYVPALIVLSFFVFIMIPDTLTTVFVLRDTKVPGSLQNYVYCSYLVGFSCDAIVYTFLSPLVRTKLALFGNCRSNANLNNRVAV